MGRTTRRTFGSRRARNGANDANAKGAEGVWIAKGAKGVWIAEGAKWGERRERGGREGRLECGGRERGGREGRGGEARWCFL